MYMRRLFAALFAASLPHLAVAVSIVPGWSDPWLAGMPDGSTASSGDVAPAQSPVLMSGITLTSGEGLRFTSTGLVSHGPSIPLVGPDGNASAFTPHGAGAENGISDVYAPVDALMGLFLDDAVPNLSAAPGRLDFGSAGNVAGGIDYLTLSPLLKQVFFVGDGLTSGGIGQVVVVPAGATRLVLGTMDGFGWYNNQGSFSVTAAAAVVPEPATAALLGIGCLGLFWWRRRTTVLAVLLSCAATLAQANLVSNFSFEDPGFTHHDWNDNFRYLSDAGDTSITGWTVERLQTVGEPAYWYHSSRYPTYDGEYALALTDGSRATTQVSILAGEEYRVSFFSYRDLQEPVGDFALRVSVGTFAVTLLPADAVDTGVAVPIGGPPQDWLEYSFAFRSGVAGTVPLTIANVPDGIGCCDGGLTLDAVTVSTVPEPAPILLLAPAVGLLWLVRRGLCRPDLDATLHNCGSRRNRRPARG